MWARLSTAAALAMLAVGGCASPTQHQRQAQLAEANGNRFAPEAAREERGRLLDQAVALALDGRFEAALRHFAVLAERSEAAGDAEQMAEALFWIGYCHEKMGQMDTARKLYERVRRDHPRTPAARQASERLDLLKPPLSPPP